MARATRLVTQLLTLARLEPEEEEEQETSTKAATNLLTEVREALAELSPLAIERNQTLDLVATETDDWQLATEPGAIGTLVQNLVGNALRYSPDGGRVTVALQADDVRLTLQVDDQGPGVPAAERERVTERFHRVGPGAGAGLGLSIVERLLARHGGTLDLGPAPESGLRVVATLPRFP
ncbi:sensor histidine kinase [Halomonas piscis]|uniref:sensor histidine kinase n=1 Tax=Halomonas piscis TaxID=3031727 RepID=UPI00289B992B|nr:sensor histidine kinase [Halomonas piscis]